MAARSVLFFLVLAATVLPIRQARASDKGGTTVQTAAPELDQDIEQFRFTELKDGIADLPATPERDYYAGMLANREGKSAESSRLLEKALPWAKQNDAKRAAWMLEALADDYSKMFRYNDAARAYEDMFQHYKSQLDKAQHKDDDDDFQVLQLLREAPPQTIQINGPVDLPTERNSILDTINTKLTVNGVTESWIIDTGANLSTVSESFAHRIGAKISSGEARTQGITGAENRLRVAILPELHLGGAVARNVVLLVLPDENLNVPSGPKSRYQIQAILGYPVLQALGRFTLTHGGHFLAGPDSPTSESGAPLYMYKLTPLLQCQVDGRPLIFAYDSGADHTAFSDRYFREFPAQFKNLNKGFYGMGGAGGVRKMKVFFLPEVQLGIGSVTATLMHVPVLPAMGTNLSKYYGNLGRDLTDPYDQFTVDFEKMRLSLGKLAQKDRM